VGGGGAEEAKGRWGGVKGYRVSQGWGEEGRVGRGGITSLVQQPTARDRQPPFASDTRSASAVISAHVSGLCAPRAPPRTRSARPRGGLVWAVGLGVRLAQWLRGG
jgi:hypothetical protein